MAGTGCTGDEAAAGRGRHIRTRALLFAPDIRTSRSRIFPRQLNCFFHGPNEIAARKNAVRVCGKYDWDERASLHEKRSLVGWG